MAPLPQIECSGTPYEIGFAHGTQARALVAGSIRFYASLFSRRSGRSWAAVRSVGASFVPRLRAAWPDLLDELAGVADGAGTDLLSVVALNVRTEIAFGLATDGCTALAWRPQDPGKAAFLAQNWDWETPQREHLVLLDVRKEGCPRIRMVTEAGIIGKIGFNEDGVGVCLNAIREKGMDVDKIPCHLGLRLVLESRSKDEAVEKLERYGVASACHMLVADASGAVGLEWRAAEGHRIDMDKDGKVFHSNHFVHPDMKGKDTPWLSDSEFRLERIATLSETLKEPDMAGIQKLFRDEKNYPGAICRKQDGESHSETLFNIVMDLTNREARITIGRPVNPLEQIAIQF